MQEKPIFDHEKLDVYRRSIEFVTKAGDLLDGPLEKCRLSAVNQLDRASTSIPLNIAEGNGEWTVRDRSKFLDTARASSLESASALDVLVARKRLTRAQANDSKLALVPVVQMLSNMAFKLYQLDRDGRTRSRGVDRLDPDRPDDYTDEETTNIAT